MRQQKLFSLALAASIFAISCNDSKKDSTTVTTDTVATAAVPVTDVAKYAATEGKSTTITVDKVPANVKTTFSTKYPKAQKVVWVEYQPVESDYLTMDSTYYYVHFNDNGTDY